MEIKEIYKRFDDFMMQMRDILNILEKYLDDYQKEWLFWAEHDIIGFCIDYENISKEDLESLDELGVFYSDEYNSLIMFV